MFKSRLLFIFLLPFALLTSLAYGQVFLGNVFRLGQSTDAAKPAAATVNKGGLLFITDGDAGTGTAGAIAYSNGSSWLPLTGSSSSGNFWIDGGPGNIMALERLANVDGGTALDVSIAYPAGSLTQGPMRNPTGASFGVGTAAASGASANAWALSSPGTFGAIVTNTANTFEGATLLINNRNTGGMASVAFINDATATSVAGYAGKISTQTSWGDSSAPTGMIIGVTNPSSNSVLAVRNESSGTLMSTFSMTTAEWTNLASSGNDAIQMTTGARIHIGGGTTDYAMSDGVQWTWGGPPLLPSYVTGSLPASSNGGLAYDSTVGQPKYYNGGWQPFIVATPASTTLYVDPTGNDSNACTSTGTSACLTLAGALGKLPRFINHTTTINLAAGTYSANLNVSNFIIASGITMTITGPALTNFAPSTGTATGTTTASAAGSASAGLATITDSGQTWTVNNLRGQFLTVAGISYPIVSNTATTVSFPHTSALGTGVAYSIQSPAASTGSSGSVIRGVSGAGSLAISRLTHVQNMAIIDCPAPVTFTNFQESDTGSTGISTTNSYVTLVYSYALSSAGYALSVDRGVLLALSVAARGSTFGGIATAGRETRTFLSASSFEGASTGVGNPAVQARGPHVEVVSSWITCTGGAGSYGIATEDSSDPPNVGGTHLDRVKVSACVTAVSVVEGSYFKVEVINIDNATTGLEALRGGRIYFMASTPTFTTVTNELAVDESTFYTFAALAAANALTNAYNSTLIE